MALKVVSSNLIGHLMIRRNFLTGIFGLVLFGKPSRWEEFAQFCRDQNLGDHEDLKSIFKSIDNEDSHFILYTHTEKFIVAYAKWMQSFGMKILVVNETEDKERAFAFQPELLIIFTRFAINRELHVSQYLESLINNNPRVIYCNCRMYPEKNYLLSSIGGEVPVTVVFRPR